jgi:hypothetical protein
MDFVPKHVAMFPPARASDMLRLETRRDTSLNLTPSHNLYVRPKTRPNVNIETHGLQARVSINRKPRARHDGHM